MKSLYKGALSARRGATDGITSGIFRAGTMGLTMTVLALLFSSCDRDSKEQTGDLMKRETS